MKQERCYKADFLSITSHKPFLICTLLVVLLAFGFATFHLSVSRDDLQGVYYTGSGMGMLASGRFTIQLIDSLAHTIGSGPATAYANDLLAILGLLWSAVNFCILFRRICADTVSSAACTVFTCVFVSYPLIAELWEYIGAYRVVAFGYLCDSFALLMMYDVLHRQGPGNVKKVIVSCLLMMLVCAGYESLVPVYIFCVFAILAFQVVYGRREEKKLTEIIRQGLCYAGVLVAGLILRLLVHKIILATLNLQAFPNGDTAILWGTAPAGEILIQTLLGIWRDYFLGAIIYFPLTEVAVAAVILLFIGILAGYRHGWTILLPGFGMYVSLILLCFVQGCVTGYRCCQVFTMFVALTAMLVVKMVEGWKKPRLRTALLVLCGYLCFHQANFTNYFLTLNYMRSQEETAVIRNIGTDLYRNFDMEKPVIFVGTYTLSKGITDAASIPEHSLRWRVMYSVYERAQSILYPHFGLDSGTPSNILPQTNVSSVIEFSRYAFDGNQESMQLLFSHLGFEYILPDCIALQSEADAYVEDHNIPAYPKEGYIQDVGDYILVHIA